MIQMTGECPNFPINQKILMHRDVVIPSCLTAKQAYLKAWIHAGP
jgi:hypothetical protein